MLVNDALICQSPWLCIEPSRAAGTKATVSHYDTELQRRSKDMDNIGTELGGLWYYKILRSSFALLSRAY